MYNASVHVGGIALDIGRALNKHACASARFKFQARRCAEFYRYVAHPTGTQQDPGVSLRCVLRALRRGTPEQHQLGHWPGAGQHPYAGVHVFLQNVDAANLDQASTEMPVVMSALSCEISVFFERDQLTSPCALARRQTDSRASICFEFRISYVVSSADYTLDISQGSSVMPVDVGCCCR